MLKTLMLQVSCLKLFLHTCNILIVDMRAFGARAVYIKKPIDSIIEYNIPPLSHGPLYTRHWRRDAQQTGQEGGGGSVCQGNERGGKRARDLTTLGTTAI